MIGFYSSFLYLISAVLFILSLNGLSHPETSRRGNIFGMIGMGIAVFTTLSIVSPNPITYIIMPITEFLRDKYSRLLQHNENGNK